MALGGMTPGSKRVSLGQPAQRRAQPAPPSAWGGAPPSSGWTGAPPPQHMQRAPMSVAPYANPWGAAPTGATAPAPMAPAPQPMGWRGGLSQLAPWTGAPPGQGAQRGVPQQAASNATGGFNAAKNGLAAIGGLFG